MRARTAKITIDLTATMVDFLDQQVRDGRAIDRGEAVRFLIGQEIKYWENTHNRAFPPAVFRTE